MAIISLKINSFRTQRIERWIKWWIGRRWRNNFKETIIFCGIVDSISNSRQRRKSYENLELTFCWKQACLNCTWINETNSIIKAIVNLESHLGVKS